MNENYPIRALHCAGALAGGGIETWLCNVVKIKTDKLKIDLLLNYRSEIDKEIAGRYGVDIYYYPQRNPFLKKLEEYKFIPPVPVLDKLLAENKYDVVHVHGTRNRGYTLKKAAQVSVPLRVAHCHSFPRKIIFNSFFNIQNYLNLICVDKPRLYKYSNCFVACCNRVGKAAFREDIYNSKIFSPLYCGIPIDDFLNYSEQSKKDLKSELGISESHKIICHIGNKNYLKNHFFLLDVFKTVVEEDRNVRLVLVGSECMMTELVDYIQKLGLNDYVILAGFRRDIPLLLQCCADMFLLPSLSEGLSVASLEALAAGLHVVGSVNAVPDDLKFAFPDRITTLKLSDEKEMWKKSILSALQKKMNPPEAAQRFSESKFTTASSVEQMVALYQKFLNR